MSLNVPIELQMLDVRKVAIYARMIELIEYGLYTLHLQVKPARVEWSFEVEPETSRWNTLPTDYRGEISTFWQMWLGVAG
jgi:hypothetical protein